MNAWPPGGTGRKRRHTKMNRCIICDGADGDPRGTGKRCMGFDSDDDKWVQCSREEFAGALRANDAGLYPHLRNGLCNCGVQHGFDTGPSVVREMSIEYDYIDAHGNLAYQVVRKPGKKFLQRRPDGRGDWDWNLNGVARIPFRLPELLNADPSATILICEGEKDVLTASDMGFIATCNPGGAGKWSFVEGPARAALKGRTVVVVADADDVGRKHALDVVASLAGYAAAVVSVELPGQKDLTDAVRAGMTAADMLSLCATALHTKAFEPPKVPRPKMVLEIARELMALPKVERLPMGVPSIDAMMRGGIPYPRLVVIGGGPGTCKTSFALAIAHHNAKRDVACAILAADEGRDGIIMRLAQREGLSAAQLQDGEGNDDVRRMAWEMAIPRIGPLPMLVEEGDEEHVTVEYMAEWLDKIAKGKPGILIVDSVQTVRTNETVDDDSIRSRVDAVIRALKKIAKRHLVIAISEVGRGWYRNKREQIDPMAAFKESGGIEYAAQTAIVLSTVPDDDNAFDAVMPKNRGYQKAPFRLALDRARMTFTEAPVPDAEQDAQNDRRRRTGPKGVPVDTVIGVLERLVRQQPGMGAGEFRAALMRESGCGEPTAMSAISNARASGLIVGIRRGSKECIELGNA